MDQRKPLGSGVVCQLALTAADRNFGIRIRELSPYVTLDPIIAYLVEEDNASENCTILKKALKNLPCLFWRRLTVPGVLNTRTIWLMGPKFLFRHSTSTMKQKQATLCSVSLLATFKLYVRKSRNPFTTQIPIRRKPFRAQTDQTALNIMEVTRTHYEPSHSIQQLKFTLHISDR